MDGDSCPICGFGVLTKKIIAKIFSYKGEEIIIKDYVIYKCSFCKESIVDNQTLKDTSHILKKFKTNVKEKI